MKEIVIIEDTRLHQQKIKDVVLELGYKVAAIFSCGEKAVDYILKENNRPDLIIIDIILEGKMNGYQVAEKISSEGNIPFIFLSGRSAEIKDFKASVYLNKPFNNEELKNNIELALYKHDIYQKMLKSNEEKEMILDTVDTQIWYLKDSVTYGRVNKAHADFIGLDKSEIENKNIKKFFDPDEVEAYKLGNQKVFKEKKKIQTEKWLKNAEGEKRLLAVTKNPKLNKKGEVEYVVCSARDITKDKKTEKIIKDLHKIAVNFTKLETEKEICQAAVEAAENLLDFNLCNILIVKEDKFVTLASSSDFEQERISISQKSIAAKTYNLTKSFIIDDLQNNPEAVKIKNIYKSAISIPIDNYGVFQVTAPEKNAFNENDLELAEILTSHVTAVLDRVYAQQEIKEQKKFLSTILEVQSGLVLLLDCQGKIVRFNNACEKLTGYAEKEVKGKTIWDLFIKNDKKKEVKKVFNQLKNRDYPNEYENYLLTKKGEERLISWSNNVILDEQGQIKYIVATGIDITERKKQEEELKNQKVYFEQLFNNSTEAIVLLDNKHRVIKINKKFESLFGFKESEIINKNLDNFILPDKLFETGVGYTKKVKQGEKVEAESIRKTKNGDKIHVFLQGFPIRLANGQVGIYALYKDITESKERQKKIEYLSFHDEMTGLYNRRYFENELKRLESSRKYPITIVIGDLDGLKFINDTYGHKKGDEYIINAADILKSTARAEDVIARIGGDEFAVILPNTNHNEAGKFCQRIQKNITEFNEKQKTAKKLSISLGFEVLNDKNQNLDKVFNKADQKMYVNKGRKYNKTSY
ncbi:PAS domain S-box-containing protein/diguanylate cyclase (GGDEF)-like protein [Halanaerobium sp. DL-01]|uniref:PAS domain S-box protein n=1 Tax=Halanaerobium sp. DL-01 TaxID=1653064 RepID=UPI000DF1D352|nr:PAS domain S-box protein [Halanaerobium sp. DL-01]RCW82540.1 PAS domain S-box-containing protein/diguanylate cyclase (GGDEF)-like protein [Halanaerobium sp. DL-01]